MNLEKRSYSLLIWNASSLVTHHQYGNLAINGLNLLKSSQHEHGSLSHTRLCLTKDVHTEHSLRDTLMLNFGRMLESTIHDGPQNLWLEKEISESTGVNGHVGSLHGVFFSNSSVLGWNISSCLGIIF